MDVKPPVNCKGRFMGLTGLVTTALETLEPTRGIVTTPVLREAYRIIGLEDLTSQDHQDRYFNGHKDVLRPCVQALSLDQDPEAYLALVPLVSRAFSIDQSLVDGYVARQGGTSRVAQVLGKWHQSIDLDQELRLGMDEHVIGIKKGKPTSPTKGNSEPGICLDPARVSLEGFSLRTKFGIGKVETDLVVPDAPFCIELYDLQERLGLVVGFWYQRDVTQTGKYQHKIVVSQIQQPQGAHLPGEKQDSQMGIVALELATMVARHMGVGSIRTYSAETHPLFLQHPERKGHLKGEFVCLYDSSAKALGFDGTRSTSYQKRVE
jgi:hypothetical protein